MHALRPGVGCEGGAALARRLMTQLAADCSLLEELRVMDYSLLLGIHARSSGWTSSPHATDRVSASPGSLPDLMQGISTQIWDELMWTLQHNLGSVDLPWGVSASQDFCPSSTVCLMAASSRHGLTYCQLLLPMLSQCSLPLLCVAGLLTLSHHNHLEGSITDLPSQPGRLGHTPFPLPAPKDWSLGPDSRLEAPGFDDHHLKIRTWLASR